VSTRAVPFCGEDDTFSGVFAGLAEKLLIMTGRRALPTGTVRENICVLS